MTMGRRTAIIIGGGPAGLTAAYELLKRSDIQPIVLERDDCLGGISRTVNYKGNRIDIGGHRFFSKSDRVMEWWLDVLPLQGLSGPQVIRYQQRQRAVEGAPQGPDPDQTDQVMLLRTRKSRIYFLRQFFDYPISLTGDTLRKLGLWRMVKIGFSYLRSVVWPIRQEKNLEQFFINRFGRQLYLTFFKSYTEKVWGVPCQEISAEWGKQRIKGLSITKTIAHFLKKGWGGRKPADISQKDVETSLIEQFIYPKLGPGQMWEEVARRVQDKGGRILLNRQVEQVEIQGNRVVAVTAVDPQTGVRERFAGDFFFSTMAIKDLIRAMPPAGAPNAPPADVREISAALQYRDFITVGLLLPKLKVKDDKDPSAPLLRDNWIYIQEPDVLVGRLQIFNNWSPYMVADPRNVWIGMEYFCYDTDPLWKKSDPEMVELAAGELDRIGIIDRRDVLDATVIRMPKTYPAYFGAYEQFPVIREFLDKLVNLFPVGRNGMHRYNNQDHSMLTAMTAVDNILEGRTDKANIWDVNTEQEYHEEKN